MKEYYIWCASSGNIYLLDESHHIFQYIHIVNKPSLSNIGEFIDSRYLKTDIIGPMSYNEAIEESCFKLL